MWGAIGAIGAGLISSAGQIYTNQKNLSQTNKWNDVQVDLANTAHQREVLDLKAAGLNPILSAHGSGASVPSLGTANLGNPGQGLSDGLSSASKYMSDAYKAEVNSLKANTEQVQTVNSALKADREVYDMQRETEKHIADMERDAAEELSGTFRKYTKNGVVVEHDPVVRRKNLDLIKQGYISDWKMRSNQNWRANLSSFIPFTSPSGFHSATQGAREAFKLKRMFYK